MVTKTTIKKKLKIKKGTAKLNTPNTLMEAVTPMVIPMGELQAQIKNAKGVLDGLNKQYGVYTKEVTEFADTFLEESEKEAVSDGDYTVKISAKKMSAVVEDKEAVILALEAVQEGLALEIATFGITVLRKYFTEEEFANLTNLKAGNRAITM